jgi:hypothetical protein
MRVRVEIIVAVSLLVNSIVMASATPDPKKESAEKHGGASGSESDRKGPDPNAALKAFIAAHPEWAAESSYVVYRDNPRFNQNWEWNDAPGAEKSAAPPSAAAAAAQAAAQAAAAAPSSASGARRRRRCGRIYRRVTGASESC